MNLSLCSPPVARPTSRLASRAGRTSELFSSLEARQLMAGDLGIEIADAFAPLSFYTPGETITVPVVVRNNFAAANPAGTQMRVTIEMIDEFDNIAISRTVTAAAPIAADAVTNLNVPVPVLSFGDDTMAPGGYAIRATVEFVTGEDEFENDNVAVETDAVNVRWAFGNFEGRNGLTFRSADADGTTFTITASGGGGGEISIQPIDGPGVPTLVFISGGASSVLTFGGIGRLAGEPGANADTRIDFQADIFILRDAEAAPAVATFGGIAAPALDLTGSILYTSPETGSPVVPALTAGPITIGDLNGNFDTDGAAIGAFTARDVTGTIFLDVAGAVRFNSFTGVPDGLPTPPPEDFSALRLASLTITTDITAANFEIDDTSGPIAIRDVIDSSFFVGGAAGAVTIRDIQGSDFDFSDRTGAFVARNITDSAINISGILPSFTAADMDGKFGNTITVNEANLRFGRTLAVTLGNVLAPLTLEVNAHISALSLNKWVVSEGFVSGPGLIAALSAGSVTVRGVTPAGQTDPDAGLTQGDFVFVGGTGRSSTADSVNINGLFTGQFLAGGSVGSFTARAIDGFNGESVRPSVVVGGALRSFTITNSAATAPSLDSRAAVWARNFNTVTANIGGDASSLEIAAGAQIAPADIFSFINQDPNEPQPLDNFVSWGSGSVGALNLTFRAAATGFTGRFTAGINADLSGPSRDLSGNLQFDEAARTTRSNTVSRINTINVSGPGATGDHSIQFGFITFPAAAFTYAGTASTRISPTLPANAPGFIESATGFAVPADTFFRLGRPII